MESTKWIGGVGEDPLFCYLNMMHVAVKPIEITILGLLQEDLKALGFDVVRIQVRGKDKLVLELIIDRLDGENVNIKDCVQVSHHASSLLDVGNPIDRAYSLQVFSPGFDRPLTRSEDFVRFQGEVVRVRMADGIEGRKNFQGRIKALENDKVVLEMTDVPGEVSIDLHDITQANLVV